MAASTTIVTSGVYSIPRVTGDTALLFDPHDIDAHVSALERLLEDDTERRTLAQEAHERAQQFTWEQSAANTTDVYRRLLSTSMIYRSVALCVPKTRQRISDGPHSLSRLVTVFIEEWVWCPHGCDFLGVFMVPKMNKDLERVCSFPSRCIRSRLGTRPITV
jgi:hypothetical protein